MRWLVIVAASYVTAVKNIQNHAVRKAVCPLWEERGVIEDMRRELYTNTALSHPLLVHRRCWQMGDHIWGYCGIAGFNLITFLNEQREVLMQWERACPVGMVSIIGFGASLLFHEERRSYLTGVQIGFNAILEHHSLPTVYRSRWPVFGVLVRLADEIRNGPEHVSRCDSLDNQNPQAKVLARELRDLIILHTWPSKQQAQDLFDLTNTHNGTKTPQVKCSFAKVSAWVILAGHVEENSHDRGVYLQKAVVSLRRIVDNGWTIEDLLASDWPVLNMLHTLSLPPVPQISNVPLLTPATNFKSDTSARPLRFAFMGGFARSVGDQPGQFIRHDLKVNLPLYFGMLEGYESWDVNFVYVTGDERLLEIDYHYFPTMVPGKQRLVWLPNVHSTLGEKDDQCYLWNKGKTLWKNNFLEDHGGIPKCWLLPDDKQSLLQYTESNEPDVPIYIYKPPGLWGGRGVQITRSIDSFLAWPEQAVSFDHGHQCFGLHEIESNSTLQGCKHACMDDRSCKIFSYHNDQGCWAGSEHFGCTPVGEWTSGKKVKGPAGLVQSYVQNPVLAKVGNSNVKTDIRVYGAVVGVDPLRIYISQDGYYRTGYPNKNYATDDASLEDRYMHITHHIQKYEEGHWVEPSPFESEEIEGSCGTLNKWYRDILPKNLAASKSGKTVEDVKESIQLVLTRLILSAYPDLSCRRAAQPDEEMLPCDTTGFHFTSDLVIDDTGKVFIMEIHTNLGLKSHGYTPNNQNLPSKRKSFMQTFFQIL